MTVCPHCNSENDKTRVFCRNCGERLPKSESAPAASEPERNARRHTARPLKKRVPWLPTVAGVVRELVLILIFAALLATVVQAIRPPDGLPPYGERNTTAASLLAADVQSALQNVHPRGLEISDDQANNFLACRVAGWAGGGVLNAQLARSYAVFEEGSLRFGVEQRLFGTPIHLQLGVRPVPKDGGMACSIESASIGRLPIPAPMVPVFAMSFDPVIETLSTPLGWLREASSVDITSQGATVNWPGATPVR